MGFIKRKKINRDERDGRDINEEENINKSKNYEKVYR